MNIPGNSRLLKSQLEPSHADKNHLDTTLNGTMKFLTLLLKEKLLLTKILTLKME